MAALLAVSVLWCTETSERIAPHPYAEKLHVFNTPIANRVTLIMFQFAFCFRAWVGISYARVYAYDRTGFYAWRLLAPAHNHTTKQTKVHVATPVFAGWRYLCYSQWKKKKNQREKDNKKHSAKIPHWKKKEKRKINWVSEEKKKIYISDFFWKSSGCFITYSQVNLF